MKIIYLQIIALFFLSLSAYSAQIDILCDGERTRSRDKFTLMGVIEETTEGLSGKLTFDLSSNGNKFNTQKSTYKVQGNLSRVNFDELNAMDSVVLHFKNANSEFSSLELKINNSPRREKSKLQTRENGSFFSDCTLEYRG